MSAKTKIIVVKAKELIYTALFIFLGLILVLLCIFMFAPKKSSQTTGSTYTPGVYTSTLKLGETSLDVAVSVDGSKITSVSLENMTESVSAMYPLLEPSLDEINSQLENISSIDDLNISGENHYTTLILQQAIKNALEKAR